MARRFAADVAGYSRLMSEDEAGTRFVAFPGKNHIPLEGDPASQRLFEEIKLFVGR
jgi:hypothetical protein